MVDSRDALMSASAEIHESVDEPAVPAPDVLLSPLVLKRLMGRLFRRLGGTGSRA